VFERHAAAEEEIFYPALLLRAEEGVEETEGIPDFVAHSEASLRDDLGARFLAFNAAHPCAEDLDLTDKDPDAYIRAHGRGGDVANG
jgi:hypothetical protein